MTKQQNIAIIGAGITGLTTAYVLSQNNHAITLYDKEGFPAHNASAQAGGMLAPYSEIEHMPPAWIKAGFEGIKFWHNFAQNHDIDFHANGSLMLACPEDAHMLTRFKTHLPPDIQNHPGEIPAALSHFKHMLNLPEEAHLDPLLTMQALSDTIDGSIKTQSVAPTEIKDHYDTVIDARGMGAIQDDPDLRGVKGESLLVHNPEFTLDRPVRLMHPRYPLYIVPRQNHRFMIGATIIESADNTDTSLRSAMELMSALYTLHRSFGESQIIEITAGIRPSYPNNLPKLTVTDNIIRANGLFRHGYLLSPIIAEAITAHISGQTHHFMEYLTHGNSDKRSTKSLRRSA